MRGTRRHGRDIARRTLTACALTLTATLGWAVPAHASAFGDTFNDYRAHGKVNACKFSAHELKQAKKQVPPDIEQYAPDFPAALDAALQAQARGACGGGGGGSGAASGVAGAAGTAGGSTPPGGGGSSTASAPTGTPAPHPVASSPLNVNVRNASHLTHGTSDPPAPIIVIALIAAALGLPALVWGLARWRGWQPAWLPGARHTLAEATWRTGNGWAEFADWLRFGH
jgi:hypothetical protein